MTREKHRTAFVFDSTPWKVSICPKKAIDCFQGTTISSMANAILIAHLPQAPEPGRIPEGADHIHIEPKYSGAADRDVREDVKWRSLMRATARCEHGRTMRDPCKRCPGGQAPDITGMHIGHTSRGVPVRIPAYEELDDIRAWTRKP